MAPHAKHEDQWSQNEQLLDCEFHIQLWPLYNIHDELSNVWQVRIRIAVFRRWKLLGHSTYIPCLGTESGVVSFCSFLLFE